MSSGFLELSSETSSSLRAILDETQAALDANEDLPGAYERLETEVHRISQEVFEKSQMSDVTPEDDGVADGDDVIDADYEPAKD